jgi:alpha-tubulin suppressor-like RCC1 family protein
VITAGGFHSCAVLENGTVRCWGGNDTGQLGYGDTDDRGDNANEMGDDLDPIDLGAGRTASAVAGREFPFLRAPRRSAP